MAAMSAAPTANQTTSSWRSQKFHTTPSSRTHRSAVAPSRADPPRRRRPSTRTAARAPCGGARAPPPPPRATAPRATRRGAPPTRRSARARRRARRGARARRAAERWTPRPPPPRPRPPRRPAPSACSSSRASRIAAAAAAERAMVLRRRLLPLGGCRAPRSGGAPTWCCRAVRARRACASSACRVPLPTTTTTRRPSQLALDAFTAPPSWSSRCSRCSPPPPLSRPSHSPGNATAGAYAARSSGSHSR